MMAEQVSQFVCMIGESGAELRIMPDGRFIVVGNEVETAKALGREYYDCDPKSTAVVEIGAREAFELLARECDEETLLRYAYALARA